MFSFIAHNCTHHMDICPRLVPVTGAVTDTATNIVTDISIDPTTI
jgi:hypothetical protein